MSERTIIKRTRQQCGHVVQEKQTSTCTVLAYLFLLPLGFESTPAWVMLNEARALFPSALAVHALLLHQFIEGGTGLERVPDTKHEVCAPIRETI